jgi:hypothetical protein
VFIAKALKRIIGIDDQRSARSGSTARPKSAGTRDGDSWIRKPMLEAEGRRRSHAAARDP